ncbi:MAG: GDSL-type esterase/lipase family protein, partial [Haloechinothrix sp.]
MRRYGKPQASRWHGRLVLTLAGVLVAVLFLFPGDVPQPERLPGPPGKGPLTLVSIGDSSLSGEGTGIYTPDTDGSGGNWCHRSPKATVHMTSVPGIEETMNFACSGSPANHVQLGDIKQYGEPSQAAQLRELTKDHRIAGVIVAVGANDEPQFSRLLPRCARAWFRGPPCSSSIAPQWQSRVDAMKPKVVRALSDIRKVLADAGYQREDYQLILQSYASPIGPGIPENLRNLDGCPFQREDLRWFATDGVRALSEALRAVADQVDARFLDLSRAGIGHEACSGGNDPGTEWFSRLTVRWNDLGDTRRAPHAVQESFHTNVAGHAQFGGCLTEFLASSAGSGACVIGVNDNLRAVLDLPSAA